MFFDRCSASPLLKGRTPRPLACSPEHPWLVPSVALRIEESSIDLPAYRVGGGIVDLPDFKGRLCDCAGRLASSPRAHTASRPARPHARGKLERYAAAVVVAEAVGVAGSARAARSECLECCQPGLDRDSNCRSTDFPTPGSSHGAGSSQARWNDSPAARPPRRRRRDRSQRPADQQARRSHGGGGEGAACRRRRRTLLGLGPAGS